MTLRKRDFITAMAPYCRDSRVSSGIYDILEEAGLLRSSNALAAPLVLAGSTAIPVMASPRSAECDGDHPRKEIRRHRKERSAEHNVPGDPDDLQEPLFRSLDIRLDSRTAKTRRTLIAYEKLACLRAAR